MTTSEHEAPSLGRRALAVLALLSTAALVVVMVAFLSHSLFWLIVSLIGLAVAAAGVWGALTERKLPRAVGLAVMILGALLIREALVQAIDGSRHAFPPFAGVVAAPAVAAVAARTALAPDRHEIDRLRALAFGVDERLSFIKINMIFKIIIFIVIILAHYALDQ